MSCVNPKVNIDLFHVTQLTQLHSVFYNTATLINAKLLINSHIFRNNKHNYLAMLCLCCVFSGSRTEHVFLYVCSNAVPICVRFILFKKINK